MIYTNLSNEILVHKQKKKTPTKQEKKKEKKNLSEVGASNFYLGVASCKKHGELLFWFNWELQCHIKRTCSFRTNDKQRATAVVY